MPQRLANHRTNHSLAQPPLGTEGGRASGDGWGCEPHWRALGKDAPTTLLKPAERRRWREGCPPTGALIARTNARCGLAISVTVQRRDWHTTPHCLTLIPRRRVPARGVVGAKRIKVGVFAHGHHDQTDNVCCVRSRKQSCMPTSPRSSRYFVGASGLVPGVVAVAR